MSMYFCSRKLVLPRSIEPSQFTSWGLAELVREHHLVGSMGTAGDCFDTPMESFWGSTQIELLNRRKWRTKIELSIAIAEWIEHLQPRTPAQMFSRSVSADRLLACALPSRLITLRNVRVSVDPRRALLEYPRPSNDAPQSWGWVQPNAKSALKHRDAMSARRRLLDHLLVRHPATSPRSG